MVGGELILFPDTGPAFSKSLKVASLYAERVGSLSMIAHRLVRAVRRYHTGGTAADRFLEAAQSHESEFRLLRREGIAPPDEPIGELDEADSQPEGDDLATPFSQILISCYIRDEVIRKLVRSGKVNASLFELSQRNKAMKECPPSLWHMMAEYTNYVVNQEQHRALRAKLSDAVIDRASYDLFLSICIRAADLQGANVLTSSNAFEKSIRDVRLYPHVSSGFPTEEEKKAFSDELRVQVAGNRLAHTLISRSLPSTHDLPLEDVLELRRKHKDELGSFRVGLAEIASQIDVSKSQEQDERGIQQLIRTKVDPAIEDLKVAINASKANMWKSIYGPKETAVAASVPMTVNFLTHANTQLTVMSAVATLLLPLASSVFTGFSDKKQVKRASRWSILLDMEKL
jgi:hypothetical protein